MEEEVILSEDPPENYSLSTSQDYSMSSTTRWSGTKTLASNLIGRRGPSQNRVRNISVRTDGPPSAHKIWIYENIPPENRAQKWTMGYEGHILVYLRDKDHKTECLIAAPVLSTGAGIPSSTVSPISSSINTMGETNSKEEKGGTGSTDPTGCKTTADPGGSGGTVNSGGSGGTANSGGARAAGDSFTSGGSGSTVNSGGAGGASDSVNSGGPDGAGDSVDSGGAGDVGGSGGTVNSGGADGPGGTVNFGDSGGAGGGDIGDSGNANVFNQTEKPEKKWIYDGNSVCQVADSSSYFVLVDKNRKLPLLGIGFPNRTASGCFRAQLGQLLNLQRLRSIQKPTPEVIQIQSSVDTSLQKYSPSKIMSLPRNLTDPYQRPSLRHQTDPLDPIPASPRGHSSPRSRWSPRSAEAHLPHARSKSPSPPLSASSSPQSGRKTLIPRFRMELDEVNGSTTLSEADVPGAGQVPRRRLSGIADHSHGGKAQLQDFI